MVGFTPAIEVEWRKANGSVLTQMASSIAADIQKGAGGTSPMESAFLEVSGFVRGSRDLPKVPWSEWINPPVPHVPVGPVGSEISSEIVAVQAQTHPGLIDSSRQYFQLNGPIPPDGAELIADGKRYRAVRLGMFTSWLMLVG